MTELLSPNGDHDFRRRRSSEADQLLLPTPSITPLLGSPLLSPFSPTEETLFETLEERLGDQTEAIDHAATRGAAHASILPLEEASSPSAASSLHRGREGH